jgi:YbbR domain-containing protein
MKRFLANWELKVIAVLSAIIFWVLIVGAENTFYTMPDEIPVKAFNLSENLALSKDLESVNLRLKISSRADVKNISTSDFEAYVDLTDAVEGEREVLVVVSSTNPDVSVLKVEPSNLKVKIEAKAEKELPIEYTLQGEVKDGHEVKEVVIKQANVVAMGSKEVLDGIDAGVVIVTLDGEEKEFTREYEIVALDHDGEQIPNVNFDIKEVEAQVKIDFVSDQKIVGVQPIVVGAPAENYWIKSINVDPSFVVLDGDPGDMTGIEFVDTSEVNVEGITENQTFTATIVGLSEGVVVGGTSQINISIEVEKYEESTVAEPVSPRRTVQVPVVITKFHSSQKNKTVTPPAVTLVLEGSDEVLREVNVNKLKIEIDISEYEENSARIEIDPSTFNLPNDIKIVTITPSSVTAKWD